MEQIISTLLYLLGNLFSVFQLPEGNSTKVEIKYLQLELFDRCDGGELQTLTYYWQFWFYATFALQSYESKTASIVDHVTCVYNQCNSVLINKNQHELSSVIINAYKIWRMRVVVSENTRYLSYLSALLIYGLIHPSVIDVIN